MTLRGKPVDPWSVGPFVFADEGERVGTAALVSGLDDALKVAAGHGDKFPDIHVARMDSNLVSWTKRWTGGAMCDFVILDNRKRRWVRLRGAFLRRWPVSSDCVWVVNEAEEVTGPD